VRGLIEDIEAVNPAAVPFESDASPAPRGRIDELVLGQWKRLGIEPANPCSDEVFLRRAYLDVIGTLPTLDEASRFLADHDPGKRDALIDSLLQRPEFAHYWAMKWSDLLRALPAGGRQGTTVQVKLGGQFLPNVTKVYVSGGGVQATLADYARPMNPMQATQLRDRMLELQKLPMDAAVRKEMLDTASTDSGRRRRLVSSPGSHSTQ
jgi:hypothetical protein